MDQLDYQIPIVDLRQIRVPHNKIPVDVNDERFAEPLVNVAGYEIAFESYHAITTGRNPPYFRLIEGGRQEGWLRRSLAEKLVLVNARLRPYNAEDIVLDAYRSMECQKGLWKYFYGRGQQEIENGAEEDFTKYALGYVRDPRDFNREDSGTFPAHATGASIDAPLRKIDTKEYFDMGSQFEKMTPVSVTDYFELELAKGAIDGSDPRLQNRRLMHWALSMEGFLNVPILFWHYDWDNQLYVKVARVLTDDPPEAAWHGYIDPPKWGVPDVGSLGVNG